MSTAAMVLTLIAAAEHVYFFVLESIMWTKPMGLKTFAMDAARAETTKSLALNQGVYNLFLAAGLAWGALSPEPLHTPLSFFFLGCVVIAAIVGGLSANIRILFVQGTPAAIGVVLLALSH